jgi:hypothetical protein
MLCVMHALEEEGNKEHNYMHSRTHAYTHAHLYTNKLKHKHTHKLTHLYEHLREVSPLNYKNQVLRCVQLNIMSFLMLDNIFQK